MVRFPLAPLIGLLAAATAACRPPASEDAPQREGARDPKAGLDPIDRRLFEEQRREAERHAQCRSAEEQRLAAQEHSQRESRMLLIGRLQRGEADPVLDARAAAARGDFRLVRSMTMMGTFPMGVDCRGPHGNRAGGAPLTLATRIVSDVGGSSRGESLLDAYGPAYNRTLIADPLYPYGDLCRIPEGSGLGMMPRGSDDPVDFGFPDLVPTEHPHDLHEAARRGTAAAVARMIAAPGRDGVDRPDPYGLTPLAWAVIRRRADVAGQLLAAGASPIGSGCDEPGGATAPLRLALRTGQEALAERMLSAAVLSRVTPWPAGLFEAAARGGSGRLLARMMREPHDGVSLDALEGQSSTPLPASSRAAIEAFRATLCWRGRIPAGTAVRMVGVYETPYAGPPGSPYRHRQLDRGWIRVHLRETGRPIILVLSAYEKVEWRIERAPGVVLAGVVAVGMNRPQVTGDVAGVPIVVNDQRDHCPALGDVHLFAYEEGEPQRKLAAAVERMLGRPVRDFQGRYQGDVFELR